MGSQVKTKGIVIHEMPIGEYDKRIILLAKDIGKITVFAKGARKSTSKFLAGSQIFAYGEYMLYKGKTSYNINQVSLIKPFYNIRNNIEDLTWGLYILEFIEHISDEDNPNNLLIKLLLKTLQALDSGRFNAELITEIFELKAISLIGYSPWVTSCVKCNSEDINHFSSKEGGTICDNCSNNKESIISISAGAIYAIRYILSMPIEQLYTFKLETNILNELKLVTNQFIEYNFNKKFKTLDFFKKI